MKRGTPSTPTGRSPRSNRLGGRRVVAARDPISTRLNNRSLTARSPCSASYDRSGISRSVTWRIRGTRIVHALRPTRPSRGCSHDGDARRLTAVFAGVAFASQRGHFLVEPLRFVCSNPSGIINSTLHRPPAPRSVSVDDVDRAQRGPSCAFLTDRRTLLISAPFSRGGCSLSPVIGSATFPHTRRDASKSGAAATTGGSTSRPPRRHAEIYAIETASHVFAAFSILRSGGLSVSCVPIHIAMQALNKWRPLRNPPCCPEGRV